MSSYLFAYGTLQPGHAPKEIAGAVAELQLLGKGSVRGSLYDLGQYPGAVIDSSSAKRILGTVFRLPGDEKVLRELDNYEGFDPDAPDRSLFVRRLHPVRLASGRTLRCWEYEYNRKTEGAKPLTGGRYQKALRAKSARRGTARTVKTEKAAARR